MQAQHLLGLGDQLHPFLQQGAVAARALQLQGRRAPRLGFFLVDVMFEGTLQFQAAGEVELAAASVPSTCSIRS